MERSLLKNKRRTSQLVTAVILVQVLFFNSLVGLSSYEVRAETNEGYKSLNIIPEPKFLNFSGRWFSFDGFFNFPDSLREIFNVPNGSWKIVSVTLPSSFMSYVKVKNGTVEISGDLNIAYATVLQLIKQKPGYLPEVEVREAFNFKFRGFHLDVARGGVPKVKTFKELLNFLFLLKYNYLGIYLEDLFPWENYPEIGAIRGKFSREELTEIINYGEKLGIGVFPSLELSGHMNNILSIPKFSKYSLSGNYFQLNLSNEEARNFGCNLLNEVVNFWPSEYIHVGGDENQLGGINEAAQLYEDYYGNLIEIARNKGKIPIMWGDMLLWTWPKLVSHSTWKNVIIANWDYGIASKEHFLNNIRFFKSNNITQVVAPGLWNWNAFYPCFEYAFVNLNSSLTAAREEKIFGFLITAWGDDGCECLLSYLRPLLLIAMEIAEGRGNWDKVWINKWTMLTGESKETVEARVKLGSTMIFRNLKSLLFKGGTVDSGAAAFMENTLNDISKVELSGDLPFIRSLLKATIQRGEGKLTPEELLDLSKTYSNLWLSERKPEGLEYNVEKFQSASEQLKSDKLRQTTILISITIIIVVALAISIKLYFSK